MICEASTAEYPLFLYIYRYDGHHAGATVLESTEVLKAAFDGLVRAAMEHKVEIRITDGDDFLVFHAKGGKIFFDGETEYPEGCEVVNGQ